MYTGYIKYIYSLQYTFNTGCTHFVHIYKEENEAYSHDDTLIIFLPLGIEINKVVYHQAALLLRN